MRRALAAPLVVLAAAGCGGGTKTVVVHPTLPRALASTWSADADAVAAALAAGDGCTARAKAIALQASVIAAIQARRVRPAFQERLLSAVNDLPGRITCNPAPPPAPAAPPGPPAHGPGHDHGHGHGHGRGHDR